MKTITIKDVARICGVGVTTVSRAINNHPDINEDTKKMILQVIKDNNYIPNNSARNLKRADSKTIAVLIKGITNPFFSNIIKTFEKETKKKKYTFVLQKVEDKEDEIDIAIELEKEKRLRGIVFLGGHFSHTEAKLKQLKVPFVLSTIGLTENLSKDLYSSVAVDDFKESYRMTKFLIEQGHKRIAMLTASKGDESIGRLRLDGYIKALEDSNIPVDEKLIRYMKDDLEGYSMSNGYAMMEELLKENLNFTCLFAISDSMAIGACKAIFDSGKKIPEDYSVAGFDGLEMARFYNPSLTTIKQPVEDMAEETLNILFDLIDKKTLNQHRVFSGELIIGQSTKRI